MIARFGMWTIDSGRRLVTHERGDGVHLTPKAFDLLTILIEHAPRVVRKAELHRQLWKGVFVSEATLMGLVKEVRRAFGDAGHVGALIRTSHGVGYAFAGELEQPRSPREGVDYWVLVEGRRVLLDGGEILIGRDPAADVRLDAAGVSRRHARIVITPTGAYLEDLGSKNGTKVRETPCEGRVELRDGDTIRLGPLSIVFRASSAGLSTETTTWVATE